MFPVSLTFVGVVFCVATESCAIVGLTTAGVMLAFVVSEIGATVLVGMLSVTGAAEGCLMVMESAETTVATFNVSL